MRWTDDGDGVEWICGVYRVEASLSSAVLGWIGLGRHDGVRIARGIGRLVQRDEGEGRHVSGSSGGVLGLVLRHQLFSSNRKGTDIPLPTEIAMTGLL